MNEDKREDISLKERQFYLDKALEFAKECRLVINSAMSTDASSVFCTMPIPGHIRFHNQRYPKDLYRSTSVPGCR